MTSVRRPLIAANWKMNGLAAEGEALAGAVAERLRAAGGAGAIAADILVSPPATLLRQIARIASAAGMAAGGQDCHAEASGAHTGDISAAMLKDAGASHVILGHSERRADHGEGNALVRAKAQAALKTGLVAVVCVGETARERDAGRTLDVVAAQLAGSLPDDSTAATVVVAYEPVWAIGTGRTPTLDEIQAVHAHLRALLAKRFGDGADFRLLYGGSVKAANAEAVLALADVDGALVGGASLKADEFWAIVAAAPRRQ